MTGAFQALKRNAPDSVEAFVTEDYPHLETLYRHLHRNPELSFQEKNTAAFLHEQLQEAGLEVTAGVGGHGLAGILKNGDGPVVLIRTDMDALPIREQTGLPFASQCTSLNEEGRSVPVSHACGHDMHMTVFVGTARYLASIRNQWRGTLLMIAQPAEEKGQGAGAMIEDGLFKRFPRPDYALALHVMPDIAAGSVAVPSEWIMANVDSVDVIVKGVGGHGAIPQQAKDPIVLAAQIILALQTLVSREIPPVEAGLITVGSIHAGTTHNVIPDTAHLQLTVRSYKEEIRRLLLDGIRRIVRAQALSAGLPDSLMPEISMAKPSVPAVYNDKDLTQRLKQCFSDAFGPGHVVEKAPIMAAEDFSQYGRHLPSLRSVLFWLGVGDEAVIAAAKKSGGQLAFLHSPYFAPVCEPAIKTGVRAMSLAALHLLESNIA